MNKYTIEKIINGLLCGGLLLSLYGCANQVASTKVGVVEENVPGSFVSAAETGTMDDGWVRSFNDPVLDTLVDEALSANPGIKIAEARVDQANGLTRQAESDLKPSVALGANYADKDYRGSGEGSATSIGGSWEADVWSRIRTGIAGSEESATATAADYHFARQSLAASVANAWFMATTAKLQNQFAEDVLALQVKGLDVIDAMQILGKGTERDVDLARAVVSSTQKAARSGKSAYNNSLRSLELLLGRYPSAEVDAVKTLVAELSPIPAGISSDIMERRPDLIAAEHKVAEAFYKQNEIKLLHLPRFRFPREAGLKTIDDAIAGLIAGVFTPLYASGEIEGDVHTATAKQKEAIVAYGQVALKVLTEVKSFLATEDHLLMREKLLEIEVDSNRIAYERTNLDYETGQISMLELLTVQQKWIASKIAALDTAGKRLVNRVNLHLALGGSFEE